MFCEHVDVWAVTSESSLCGLLVRFEEVSASLGVGVKQSEAPLPMGFCHASDFSEETLTCAPLLQSWIMGQSLTLPSVSCLRNCKEEGLPHCPVLCVLTIYSSLWPG